MRFTILSTLAVPALIAAMAWPASADPKPAVKPSVALKVASLQVAPQVTAPRTAAPALGIVKPSVAPSFGFAKPARPLARVTSISLRSAPRIVVPRAGATAGFQGFGAAKPPVNFQLTRPAPALGLAAEGAAADGDAVEYVLLDNADEGLPAARCDGYNPCHAQNNPAALARQACTTDTACDTCTDTCAEPCAPRRRVVRRYVVRRYQPACYTPCYQTYYRPYYSSCYSRPAWGFGRGVGYGLGLGLGWGHGYYGHGWGHGHYGHGW